MKPTLTPLLLALALALFSGDASAQNTGSARFTVSVPQSPNVTVSRVSVVASAPDFPVRSLDLTASNGEWSGILDNIPAGAQRSFRAQAFDAANNLLFEDSVSGITITANKAKRITLELEQLSAPPPPQAPTNHSPPRITKASQSSPKARPGRPVEFKVTASDPERSALTFTWSATSGTVTTPVTEPTRSLVSWTAPSCADSGTPTTVTATVTNAFGLTASTVFTLTGLPVCAAKWTATAPMVENRVVHAAALLPNGKVLVAGGDGGEPRYRVSAELYDPATGTWSPTGSMSGRRSWFSGIALPNGKVLVAGGIGPGSLPVNTAELYDPATGTWKDTNPMNRVRNSYPVTLLPNGKVLISGGLGIWYYKDAELYDPATQAWSATGAMATGRGNHTATLLPNGKVLVAGGQGSGDIGVMSSELYDPTTGTWSPTGSLAAGRWEHTGTLLPNGKVLVVGGVQDLGTNVLPTAELYDPATGTWSPTGSLVTRRYRHSAALLPNGKVLVAGGIGPDNSELSSAEVYDPATGTWSPASSMAAARNLFTMTLLPGGKVLCAGGAKDNSAEVYAP